MSESSPIDYPPMPPVPQAELDTVAVRERELRNRAVIKIAGWLGMATVAAAVAVGVAERPAPIEAGPGISIDASIQLADYSGADLGPSTLGLPKAHENFHGVDVGINLNVKKYDTQGNTSQGQTLEGTLSDMTETLGPPIRNAFYWRAGEGLAAGLAALGIMIGSKRLAGRFYKSWITNEEEQIEQLTMYEHLAADIKAHIPADIREKGHQKLTQLQLRQEKRGTYKLWQRVTAAAAGLGLFGGGGGLYHDYNSLKPPAASRTVILPGNSTNPYIQEIIDDKPMLANAFVTGDFGKLIKGGFRAVTSRMEQVSLWWRHQADALVAQALPEFRAQGGMDWQNDPDITAFLQITDVHDNRAYLEEFLPVLVQAFGPDFIVNTGDEENYSGKDILDNGAWQRFANALPKQNRHGEPFHVIMVAGNHDEYDSKAARKVTLKTRSGKTFHVYMPLDAKSKYTATLDGLTFVGSPDRNRTVHGTIPASPEGQMVNDAKQGEQLAQLACDVYGKTKQKPIGLAHEPEATYAAAVSGCTSIDVSGHKHMTHNLHIISNPDDTTTYQLNLGSASGDGPNNMTAIDNEATTDADAVLWLDNRVTGERQAILISVNPTGAVPTITAMPQPNPLPALDIANIEKFLSTRSPDSLPELALSGNKSGANGH